MSIFDMAYSVLIMPIQLLFETFFMLAYREIGNAGVSIIVLSLAMNFLVLPLYMRADKMQERERAMEAKLHDGVAHIRKTFKGDEKMMMLQTYYRQNGYKPTDVLKGSVSLFLEIPFFIAAYAYLSHLQLLQGVSFGIIRNLGAPDGLLVIGDMHINALPFVMTAINLATCLLFSKGMARNTKIQLYVMAAIFLVLLYDSPAGLVFYWTLNNVFSFVKTLFYKLKHPKAVLAVLAALAGVTVIVLAILLRSDENPEAFAAAVVFGVALLIPLAVSLLKRTGVGTFSLRDKLRNLPASKRAYVAGAVFLTVQFGLLIPSAVIGASPQEFVSVMYFVNPGWYIVSSLCLAAGTFLVWMGVFYWLTSSAYKPLFQMAVVVACGVSVVDYMCFGTNLGLLESNLQYQSGLVFDGTEMLVNVVAVVAVALVLVLLMVWLPKKLTVVVGVACVAMAGMAVYNIVGIEQKMPEVEAQAAQYQESEPSFTLSKDGKNVVIIMLDRAMNEFIPFIFNEKPALKAEFSGFTYYDNVISFGDHTNYGAPALFGGYEYTPVEMNKRDDELLVDKHNEALKVLPVLFDQSGFDVTFLDPTYAGYQWVPDLSIFDEYEDINTYITDEWFTTEEGNKAFVDANMRNFFYFSLMKGLPLFAQPVLYDDGSYNRAVARTNGETSQTVSEDGLTATGQIKSFVDSYAALQNLDTMTKLTDNPESAGSFVIMTNNATHDTMILQEPDYVPAATVDNTEYEAQHHGRFTLPEGQITVETAEQYRHYQANVAALQAIGTWLEHLKRIGVYDNTRIILVADHGGDLHCAFEGYERYYPLLMVKDFDADGFTTSSEFMTNGDVPVLALEGLIADPVNPFTGKPITDIEKTAHDQYVALVENKREYWDVTQNNGTTFRPGSWLSVHTDMRDPSNWAEVEVIEVLGE